METIINQEKISQYLSTIKTNIENDNINGYYNINRKMEDIVAKLLELVYGYNFINTNDIYPNYPAIDLADNERRISVQVTSDNSIEKINRTFEVFKNSKEKLIDKYDRIIFFMINGKLPQYDGRKIKNKGINFNKYTDIIDYSDIERKINDYTNEKLYPIASFLESQYISNLVRKISQIKKKDCKDVIDNYIERKVIKLGKNDYFNKENRKQLYKIIDKNDKIVLLSDAGEGKTQEAKNLVNKINKKEKNICAFYKRLNTYTDQKIEELIPKEYEMIPFQNLLFVFDGLDEIENKSRTTFIKNVEDFCEQNKDIKIVITCRKSFYEPHNRDYDGTLKAFDEYVLCKINEDDINEILLRENIDQSEFWKETIRKKLHHMIYNPFYLNEIVKRYIDKGKLPKKEVFLDDIINEGFLKDNNKYRNSIELKESKGQIEDLLEIIGLTLEYLGKNFLTDSEYKELINKKENRELLNYSSLWCKNDDGNWSFIHNNFGEYLAARRLSRYSLNTIKKAICFDGMPNKINHTWINTLTFLVNQYQDSELIEFLISAMPEFLSYIEKDIIDNKKRKNIFWTIYKEYKNKKKWIEYDIYLTNNLVSDEEDIKYLLAEIKENYHYTSVGNALHILNNVISLYGQEAEVKETLVNLCMDNKYTSYNKSNAIDILADFKLAKIDDLLKIIEHNKSKENSRLRKSYYYFCNTLKIVNEAIDIFIERFEIESKGMRATWKDEDEEPYFWDEHAEYEKAFGLINNNKAMNKVIHFLSDIEFSNREDTKNIIKNLCNSIFNTYLIKKELVKTLLSIYIKCEEHYNYENMNMILTKIKKEGILVDFFKEYMKSGKNKAYRVYEQIIDDECMEYYYYEYENKKFRDDITEIILRFCNNKIKFYNKLKELYEKRTKKIIQERISVDYDKIRKESKQYFFNKLFSKNEFLGLMQELKEEMPSKRLIVKELKETRHYDKLDLDSKYQYTLNFLIWQFKDKDEITEESFKNWDWDNFILSEAYKIINEDKGLITITDEQRNIIKNICNKEILVVNYRNAIKYKKDKSWTINCLCIYLWFYRHKFGFKYPDSILLDMLEFEFDFNGERLGIDYIERQVNRIEVRNRIVENINNREIHTDVFKNHIKYCINNNIGVCVDAVGKHLLNKDLYDTERLDAVEYLIKFMKLEDFINKYFYIVDLEFQKQIIGKIIEKNSLILYPWLLKKLNSSRKIECKMFFAQQLMIIGKIEGIQYYCRWMKKNKRSYINKNTYQGINTELSRVCNIEMIDYLIKILELTFSKDFKDRSFDGVYSNVRKSIIEIAINDKTQFDLVKKELQEVFERNQDYEDIGIVTYIIDEMENLYCMNNQRKFSILEIKKNIKNIDEQIQDDETKNWI